METKQATSDKTSDKNKRLIDANILVEKFLSLTLTVTGLRAGKGVILELLNKYRNGILQLINEQPTVDAAEVVRGMWIPVTERLPEHCVTVLSYNGVCIGTDFYDKGFELWCSEIEQSFHMVTHWMPLPEPPKEENHG